MQIYVILYLLLIYVVYTLFKNGLIAINIVESYIIFVQYLCFALILSFLCVIMLSSSVML